MAVSLNAPEVELRRTLLACLAVPRWVDDLVAAGPYSSLDDLVDKARRAANPLRPTEVDRALAHHPRIGERPQGDRLEHRLSRHEQQASSSLDGALSDELAAGNVSYEARFGRVFLIRAADRTRTEILSELQRRLTLDPATESAIVAGELRDIALLRIRQLFAEAVPLADW